MLLIQHLDIRESIEIDWKRLEVLLVLILLFEILFYHQDSDPLKIQDI